MPNDNNKKKQVPRAGSKVPVVISETGKVLVKTRPKKLAPANEVSNSRFEVLNDKVALYLESASLLPRITKSNKLRHAGETIKSIHSVLNTVSLVLTAVSAPLACINPIAGAAFQGVAGTCIAIVKGLDQIIKPINVKNAIIDAVNAQVGIYNAELEERLRKHKEDFNKQIDILKIKYHITTKQLSPEEFARYEQEVDILCQEFSSEVASIFISKFNEFTKKVVEVTSNKCKELNIPQAWLLVHAQSIVSIATGVANSSATKYLAAQIKEALHLEEKARKLKVVSLALLKQKNILTAADKVDDLQTILTIFANDCTRRELTMILIVAREAQKEMDNKINPKDRKYKDFAFLLEVGLDKIEQLREAKGQMELAGGAFEKLLERATQHPKAVVRMMTPAQNETSKVKMRRNELDNDAMIDLLDKVPSKHWNAIDKIGDEINRREGRGILRRFVLDAANKMANIMNNILRIGVKDQALKQGLDEFKDKSGVVAAEPAADVVNQSQFITR